MLWEALCATPANAGPVPWPYPSGAPRTGRRYAHASAGWCAGLTGNNGAVIEAAFRLSVHVCLAQAGYQDVLQHADGWSTSDFPLRVLLPPLLAPRGIQ
jgi:hypothetical protein